MGVGLQSNKMFWVKLIRGLFCARRDEVCFPILRMSFGNNRVCVYFYLTREHLLGRVLCC